MLDPVGRAEVLEAAEDLRRDGLTIIYVTQEIDQVVGADRVVALEFGVVVYSGDVAGLFGAGELVRRLGLGLPAAGELALELKARGRAFASLPLTVDELVRALRGTA